MVNDLVDLLRQLFVDFRDQRLDSAVGVGRDGDGVFQRLLRQGFHRVLDRFFGLIGLRPELFVQQRAEFIAGKVSVVCNAFCC